MNQSDDKLRAAIEAYNAARENRDRAVRELHLSILGCRQYLDDLEKYLLQLEKRRAHEEIMRELANEQASPSTLARCCRAMLEVDDSILVVALSEAERVRTDLHTAAAHGDELAIGALELLADDPFWRNDTS